MEALGQLTEGVAHDFNNLLHVIGNAATLLERRLKGPAADLDDYLQMIRRNVDRAVSVTARLLAFACRQPLEPRPTDLNRLIADPGAMLRQSVGECVAIEVVAGAALWPVAVDRHQFEPRCSISPSTRATHCPRAAGSPSRPPTPSSMRVTCSCCTRT